MSFWSSSRYNPPPVGGRFLGDRKPVSFRGESSERDTPGSSRSRPYGVNGFDTELLRWSHRFSHTNFTASTASEAFTHDLVFLVGLKVWGRSTVMESPVVQPIGSKFSIEQTMMQLSFLSRPLPSRTLSKTISDFVDQQFPWLGERSRPTVAISFQTLSRGCTPIWPPPGRPW